MPILRSLKENRREKTSVLSRLAPVAQRIEQTRPKGKIEVQFLSGVLKNSLNDDFRFLLLMIQ